MNKTIIGIHIGTYQDDTARTLYDSFTHNEITVEDIIQQWNNEYGNICDSRTPETLNRAKLHYSENANYAIAFDGNEYCDLYEIKQNKILIPKQ